MALCEVEGLGKRFDIFERPRDRVASWLGARWARPQIYWAVRNVSFVVKPGVAVGLIGGNGAGKTTLLRMLAGALKPTEGEVRRNGKTLLITGFGGGFHRALSGRQNVSLQAGLLRLPAGYAAEHMEAIQEFSELGEFFDRPVSTYSGGMRTRLSFSILAYHRPDLLLLDEALGAGDAAFAAKCEIRMTELLSSGVGVVMGTHSMAAVSKYCQEAILLRRGSVVCKGKPEEVIPRYTRGRARGLLEFA